MKYISLKKIEETGIARGLFTSGGNGWWPYRGVNGTGTASPDVNEEDMFNYRKLAAELSTDPEHMIRVDQKHTDKIFTVTRANGGEGVSYEGEEEAYDGMVTNEPGTVLCAVTADCVPVFMLDPIKKAIGLVHSGWKGTAACISSNAVDAMIENYGTDPKNLIVCLGPHICSSCYEVSDDLKADFSRKYTPEEINDIFEKGRPGHCYLDLGKAIRISLVKAGADPDNIYGSSFCTYHSEENFFSWRRDHTKGQNVLSALMLDPAEC